MIIRERKERKEQFPYGRLFLSTEAPGDEAPRLNMKTVTVGPNQRARLDFANDDLVVNDTVPDDIDVPNPAGADDVPEDITYDAPEDVGDDASTEPETDVPPDDVTLDEPGQPQTPDTTVPDNIEVPDTPPADDDVEVDLEDITYPDPGTANPTQSVTVDGTSEDPADTEDFTLTDPPGEEPGGTNPNDDNTDYTQDTAPDAPEIDPPPEDSTGDDNTDYTNVDGDNQDSNNASSDANAEQEKGPGLEYDSVRQYNLFKEFMKLRTAVDTYITKLEGCISDDPESNLIIKKATTKFRDVYALITDYMLMKFELCTYVQNLLFFEKQVATVTLIFRLLHTADDLYQTQMKKGGSRRREPKS